MKKAGSVFVLSVLTACGVPEKVAEHNRTDRPPNAIRSAQSREGEEIGALFPTKLGLSRVTRSNCIETKIADLILNECSSLIYRFKTSCSLRDAVPGAPLRYQELLLKVGRHSIPLKTDELGIASLELPPESREVSRITVTFRTQTIDVDPQSIDSITVRCE